MCPNAAELAKPAGSPSRTPWAGALGRISPLRRVGEAAEVTGVVSFLCGPDSTYITGITLNVDGGLTAMHPAV